MAATIILLLSIEIVHYREKMLHCNKKNNYLGIARVHKAMLAIRDANVGEKEAMMGELKTLRAWFYFDLNRVFKSIPYITENDDASTVPNGNLSREEIYNRIKTDLRLSTNRFDLGYMKAGETKERGVVVLHRDERDRKERIAVRFTATNDLKPGIQHIIYPIKTMERGSL